MENSQSEKDLLDSINIKLLEINKINEQNQAHKEELLAAIREQLTEIDIVNDENQKHIVGLFRVITEINKKSRANLNRQIKNLQTLIIVSIGMLALLSGVNKNIKAENFDKLTDAFIINIDKIIALGAAGVAAWKVVNTKKDVQEEEDEITSIILSGESKKIEKELTTTIE